MRAIIISDADARALLEQLLLIKLRSDVANPPTLDEVYRAFHYVVTRWLQEQGANVVE